MKVIPYAVVFIIGAGLMFFLMKGCGDRKVKKLEDELQASRDSTVASQKRVDEIHSSYDSLGKQRDTLTQLIVKHDSISTFKIDSISKRYNNLKQQYYADTVAFKKLFQRLKYVYSVRDTAHLGEVIDSIIVEARSANWSAQNLFYDCEQRDSLRIADKKFSDSVYVSLLKIDSNKDEKFLQLMTEYNKCQINNINSQSSLQQALDIIKKTKNNGLKWFFVGAVVGGSTNFIPRK